MDRQAILNIMQMSTISSLISYSKDEDLSTEEKEIVESALAVSFEDIISHVPCGEA